MLIIKCSLKEEIVGHFPKEIIEHYPKEIIGHIENNMYIRIHDKEIPCYTS